MKKVIQLYCLVIVYERHTSVPRKMTTTVSPFQRQLVMLASLFIGLMFLYFVLLYIYNIFVYFCIIHTVYTMYTSRKKYKKPMMYIKYGTQYLLVLYYANFINTQYYHEQQALKKTPRRRRSIKQTQALLTYTGDSAAIVANQ